IKEYMDRYGFEKALVGLSGGIDSAVTCALAARAAGAENMLGLSMPSGYSSKESEEYARRLAENLGIEFRVVPMGGIYDSYLDTLETHLAKEGGKGVEIYHQNLQARIRGNILMAFSNRFGYLVLATGNKSEAMMGYCTLYGDTVGGLAVLADVLKAGVYQIAGYINRDGEVIPGEIIERVPSAELKPGQKDEDNLPPYDILDRILHFYLEEDYSPDQLREKGFSEEHIDQVLTTIKKTAFKRDQLPPGIKVL
ncbi:MAG: NAD(+) synthase, partial [Candidatus Omnitrophica bacterium]|nr:NAD(+) synthase [Candidatus Omnitrophota bacterium]